MKTADYVDRNLSMMSKLNESVGDLYMMNLGMISWFNEQFEKSMTQYMEQAKQLRKEGVQVTDEMVKQMKRAQAQYQDMLCEAWKLTAQTIDGYEFRPYFDLAKQLRDLADKMDQGEKKE